MITGKALIAALICFVGMLALGNPAVAQTAYAMDSDNDNLYRVDLATGIATLIGSVGYNDVEALAFHPTTGVLYGVDDSTDSLVTCDTTTAACTLVGSLGVDVFNPGMDFSSTGTLYLVSQDDPGNLYTVNISTGVVTLIGSLGGTANGNSLALGPATAGCPSGAFMLDGINTPDIYCLNLTTGAATLVGSTGVSMEGQPAMAFDASGTLWLVEEEDTNGRIFKVDTNTGAATDVGYTLSAGGFDALTIEGSKAPPVVPSAVTPVPTLSEVSLALLAMLLAGFGMAASRGRMRD